VLVTLSQVLPRDVPTLLSVSHPISDYLRQRATELLEVIKDAIATSADASEMHDVLTQISKDIGIFVPHRLQPTQPVEETRAAPVAMAEASGDGDMRAASSSLWGSTLSLLGSTPASPNCLASSFAITPAIPPDAIETFPIPDANEAPGTSNAPSTNGSLGTPTNLNKRKHSDSEPQPDTPSSIPLSTPATEDDPSTKAMRKMQRKAEKRAQKHAKASHNAETPDASTPINGTNTPFDYNSAPSVLHANEVGKKGPKHPKPPVFDPYRKAMDAPSGVKQPVVPKAGKSHTFGKR